jgi:hypothetical protein
MRGPDRRSGRTGTRVPACRSIAAWTSEKTSISRLPGAAEARNVRCPVDTTSAERAGGGTAWASCRPSLWHFDIRQDDRSRIPTVHREHKVGAPNDLLEQPIGQPFGRATLGPAREDPVHIEPIVGTCPSRGPERRRVGHWHNHHRPGQRSVAQFVPGVEQGRRSLDFVAMHSGDGHETRSGAISDRDVDRQLGRLTSGIRRGQFERKPAAEWQRFDRGQVVDPAGLVTGVNPAARHLWCALVRRHGLQA